MTRKEIKINSILSLAKNLTTIAGSAIVLTSALLKELLIPQNVPGIWEFLPFISFILGWLLLCVSIYYYYSISKKLTYELQNSQDDFPKTNNRLRNQLIFFVFGLIFVLIGIGTSTYLNSKYPSSNIQKIKIIENEK